MSFETRSAQFRRRGTTIDDILSSDQSSPVITRRRTTDSTNQRSLSMSPMKTRSESSMRANQTLKPIIQRRSTMLNSSIAQLVRLTGVPRLHADDDAYISDTFKNENTSKFVIGTLWNTFALVNNLFLQRPRKRRNAMTGESIQAEQLARLQQMYSIAERNQNDQQTSTDNLRSIADEILTPRKTENLRTIVSNLESPTQKPLCTCYGTHHVPSCQFYDHSLPYIKKFIDRTVQLESKYLNGQQQPNRLVSRDATTQSDPDKPPRISPHLKSLHHVSTQSSPIQQFKQTYSNVSTQCSPIESQRKYINHHYVNMSTQKNPNKISTDSSTQFSPLSSEQIYVNTTVQLSPIESDDQRRISPKKAPEENIYDRRNAFFREIRPTAQPSQDQQSNPKVKNLVSLFETTLPLKKPTYVVPLIGPKVDRNLPTAVRQYANGVASKIVKNAVSTASENIIQTNEQLQKRFSLYKNGGGHGKNLLFRTNTFLPSPEQTKQNLEPNIRVESQASSVFLNDHNLLSESQHTLIVGHYIDGTESKRKKRSHSTTEPHLTHDYSSSNEDDEEEDDVDDENLDEQVDRQQFLSNSQLFSAQELYIRPWLVRRATAPDIHCLDTEMIDTRVEHLPSATFETYFHVFPSHQHHVDVYTRLTCLATILFYLNYVHDRYSNQILYDEIEQIEKEFFTPLSTSASPVIHSNTFQTINSDGSKRYRTGFVLDVKSPGNDSQRQILAQQIQWKRVKVLVRRFRKKYLYYKQFMKNDRQKSADQRNINELLKYFDSTSKRRIKKYAKHYAQKL